MTKFEMRVDPASLGPEVSRALIELKRALAGVPHLAHVQVTFDRVKIREYPPTVDCIWHEAERAKHE